MTEKKGRKNVSQEKESLVQDVLKAIENAPIIGVVNMENLPAKQLSDMRSQLRGKITLIMTKKRLLKIAIDKSKKPQIKELEKYLKGMPALLLTDQNPFALYSLLKKKRSNAPIKAGQKAPKEILVKAGPTNFAPGPVIGELGTMKIKAGIDAGKVVIKEDKIVAEEGDIIDDKLSSLLLRLGIEPMEIGLSLVAVYENGLITPAKVLDIDEDLYRSNFQNAQTEAFNVAVFAKIMTKEVVEYFIQKAEREAVALGRESKFKDVE